MFLGEAIRLARFFENGNAVVVAMDHGQAMGPVQGLEDFHASALAFREADAILLNSGMLRRALPLEIKHGEISARGKMPKIICRLNWSSNYLFQWGYKEGYNRQVVTVDEAVALGADLVLGSLFIRTASEEIDMHNVEHFGRMVSQKRRLGIPMVAEIYPSHQPGSEDFHELVNVSARMAAEMGADLIKTFYTGAKFGEIVKGCPIPILALGAEKTPKEVDALRRAYDAVQAGARGVVFGRNVFQAKDPGKFIEALARCVKKGEEPSKVAREMGLDGGKTT
ncbi:MAG: hypothetical protein V2A58_16135 [Planctomycetota bacterium]